MNKSKFINSRKCRSCGKCCKTFSLCYPKSLEKDELVIFSEVKRFQMLDTDLIEVIEKENVFLVKFNFPCKYLKQNNGLYSCEIYTKDRPELCKEYPFEETIDCPFMENKKC
jgi:Fe-S-cluster containining protein